MTAPLASSPGRGCFYFILRYADTSADLGEALAQAEKLPNVLDEPQVRHRYGKMLLDRGRTEDRDRAREMVSSALERYRRMGMPIHAAMAEELLRGV